jgi:hypothetical protein
MNAYLRQRLLKRKVWRRILRERLTEPIHLNLISAWVALFGSFKTKVDFDLVFRNHHAYSLLKAADWAVRRGVPKITIMEFGVANGAGLLNMCEVARKVTEVTGVEFQIVGFDGGAGLPPPIDYRDHPELYSYGDYPMQTQANLIAALPPNASLILGDLKDTVPAFQLEYPLGFISIDVDYYSSARDALQILEGPAHMYLPWVIVYLDDIDNETHNVHCGELLAVREFEETHPLRPIAPYHMLRQHRIFQRALWIDHMYIAHIFDHPVRQEAFEWRRGTVLDNPYVKI